MEHPLLLGLSAGMLIIGFLLIGWADRYDAAGVATDAARRMVRRRGVDCARDELGKMLEEQLTEVRADAARIGHGQTGIKHGGRFIIARFVNIAGIIMIILGLVAGAVVCFWKWRPHCAAERASGYTFG